ncbi:MAG: hypothetical protein L0Z50_09880 [Verrucomicrobiales bacterium]|nr:hypothetical protein [Verrucomicrobiales bacterium]
MNSNSQLDWRHDSDGSAECSAAGFERQTLEASEQLCRESVTTLPDGTVTATRDSAHRSLRCVQERALVVTATEASRHNTLPAPPRQLLPSTPRVDVRAALRWSLLSYGLTMLVLQPLGGWAAPGFFAQLFTQPPGLCHALAGAAATVCAHGRCARSDSLAGRLMPRAWFAFMLVPILPLPLDGLFTLMRCGLLPLAFVWAFLPVVENARTWLRWLATSTRTIPPRWLSSLPEPIAAPVCRPLRYPTLRFQPLEIVRAWFSASPTTFSDPSQEFYPSALQPSQTTASVAPQLVQAPRPQPVLPPSESQEIFVPQTNRVRVRR